MRPDTRKNPVRRILHLEDSPIDHELVKFVLQKSDVAYALHRVETLPEFLAHARSEPIDVILADYRLPGFTAIDAWTALQAQSSTGVPPPFIILSGAIGEPAAVDAVAVGVCSCRIMLYMDTMYVNL